MGRLNRHQLTYLYLTAFNLPFSMHPYSYLYLTAFNLPFSMHPYSYLYLTAFNLSLNRYESPEQTVYWPRAYNPVSTVSIYWPIQVLCCVKIGRLLQFTAYDMSDSFLFEKNSVGLWKKCLNGFDFRPFMFQFWLITWLVNTLIHFNP